MREFTTNELNEILKKHYLWVLNNSEGERANLSWADLSGTDLSGTYLCGANFYMADLSGADLSGADLYRVNLYGANLYGANLYGANLCGTNFYMADLSGANLGGAKNIPFIPMACPDSGSYTAYKKASNYIVVLEIPSDAIRFSATGRKCRANKAKVIRIENLDGSIPDNVIQCCSNHDPSFIYKIGDTVEVKDFDMNRWRECSTGIHHFINRQEAVDY